MKQQMALGLDPSEERRNDEGEAPARRARAVNSFERVAREWPEIRRLSWTPRYAALVTGRLEADIFPTIGKLDIGAIAPREILPAIRVIYLKAGNMQLGRYLFPVACSKSRTISENRMLDIMYRVGLCGNATVHGFRGLASTVLNESGLFEGEREPRTKQPSSDISDRSSRPNRAPGSRKSPEERHGGGEYARALVPALVEQLARRRGNHRVHLRRVLALVVIIGLSVATKLRRRYVCGGRAVRR